MNALEKTRPRGEETIRQTQTFTEFMHNFLIENSSETVVEVGSDVQLRVALRLAPYCTRFCSANFPEDNVRMRGWHEMHREMGGVYNIELIGGNALELSKLVPHADVIILHNVLLDFTGKDTELLWQYKRGEKECSEEEWDELISRFRRAKEEGYREFLKVAKPGYIVTFKRITPKDDFEEFLVDTLGVSQEKIMRKELFYDDSEELWVAYIVDNT